MSEKKTEGRKGKKPPATYSQLSGHLSSNPTHATHTSTSTSSGLDKKSDRKNGLSQIFTGKERDKWDPPTAVLESMLDLGSYIALRQVNRTFRETYDLEGAYEKRLLEIGPNPAKLKRSGESARAAYKRHSAIIQSLPALPEQPRPIPADLASLVTARIQSYPDYHADRILHGSRLSLHFYTHTFPGRAKYVLGRLLTNINCFNRFVSDIVQLIDFCILFPTNTDKAIKLILNNKAYFAKIIRSIDDLQMMCEIHSINFRISPADRSRALDLVLENTDQFAKIMGGDDGFASRNQASVMARLCQGASLEQTLQAQKLFKTLLQTAPPSWDASQDSYVSRTLMETNQSIEELEFLLPIVVQDAKISAKPTSAVTVSQARNLFKTLTMTAAQYAEVSVELTSASAMATSQHESPTSPLSDELFGVFLLSLMSLAPLPQTQVSKPPHLEEDDLPELEDDDEDPEGSDGFQPWQ